MAMSASVGDENLVRWMRRINVIVLILFVAVGILNGRGDLELVSQSTHRDYLHSIRPFLPDRIVDFIFPRLPISVQIWEWQNVLDQRIYFPGVAIECALGLGQGLWLGTNLISLRPSGRLTCPWFPALALYFYATMCLAAFPIHCLKDIALFDVEKRSLVAMSLMWLDTFSTASAAWMVLTATLLERQSLDPATANRFSISMISFSAILVALGAFLPNRTIMFLNHVVLLVLVMIIAMNLIFLHHWQYPSCPHGFDHILLAAGLSLLISLPLLVTLNASTVSEWTQGNYCSLTAFFVASRNATVEYWAYCKAQSQCNCLNLNSQRRNKHKLL